MAKARGIRNNNPGNLRYNPAIQWRGQVGHDGAGFVVFDTKENGIRALTIDLKNAQAIHGRNTVKAIITAYAPATENNTAGYIAAVAGDMGVTPDTALNLYDPATLAALVAAVIRHENGTQPYPVALLDIQAAAA